MTESATIKQLESLIELARVQGFQVRYELLGGSGGGICSIKGRPCLFLDVSCGPAEQLEMIKSSLQLDRR